ncbi:hypothetical protein NQ315_002468 [Exocentrus adspersus]|uniref:Mannosyltransferase n=1 Tax=Exocentrus adspersus TaxID=1586481 RepID=A0AAV8VLW7_9CUCU|nr:hypothetical protein NQ315_002468 [Exocentrus adspersus]
MCFKDFKVFLVFLVVRIASIFLVQTFFVPDEYWQSLEVAHKLVFNYGYLTWEWYLGIRSYIVPLIYAALYKVFQVLSLDSASNLIFGPRVLQACLSAYSDVCFYRWSGTKKWAVFCVASSWFWFFTGSRTLINTLECALTSISLSKFPWPGKGVDESSSFIWIIALLFVIRPTCALMWVPLCIYHLTFSKKSLLNLVMGHYLPIGLMVLILSVLLDSICHGSFIVSVFEFLKFNLLRDIASFYGVQPWHWYLSVGFPAILGINLIPFAVASMIIIKNRTAHPNELVILGTIIFTITGYSFLAHKEFRFLLPLLPLVLYVSSRFLSVWSRKASNFHIWVVTGIIFVGNVVPAWYLGMVHQRGTLDVMEPLREISMTNVKETSLLFLMPCHSTPMYSHLHVNVTTRYLTCLPNLNSIENYIDEADLFYNDPSQWLRLNFPVNGTLPSHVICFDVLVPYISVILSGYQKIHQIYHTNLPISKRIGRYVVVYERTDF